VEGENVDDGDRPWKRPGNVRRDVEPHRAVLLRALGFMSLVFGLFAPVLILPALVAFPLGIVVWLAARRDFLLMAAGEMDPDGWNMTREGRDCGVLAVILCFLAVPLALFFFVVLSFRPGV
jgi:hypothetical protein